MPAGSDRAPTRPRARPRSRPGSPSWDPRRGRCSTTSTSTAARPPPARPGTRSPRPRPRLPPRSCSRGGCWCRAEASSCCPARSGSPCAEDGRRASRSTCHRRSPPPAGRPTWSTAPRPVRPSRPSTGSSCCWTTGAPSRPASCGRADSACATSRPRRPCSTRPSRWPRCWSRSPTDPGCSRPGPTWRVTPSGSRPTRSTPGAPRTTPTAGCCWRGTGWGHRGWPAWSAAATPAARAATP